MTDRLRDLAGKIDKATPNFWELAFMSKETLVGSNIEGNVTRFMGMVGTIPDEDNAEAIIAARNEAPALLREAADEIERLQRVVDQATKWLRITDDGIIFASDEVTARAEEVPDLAQQLKEAQ